MTHKKFTRPGVDPAGLRHGGAMPAAAEVVKFADLVAGQIAARQAAVAARMLG